MTILSALIGVFGSVVGGFVAGVFVVVGVWMQFARQSEAAIRALKVEVSANVDAAKEMAPNVNGGLTPDAFHEGSPDPGWLKRAVWDSQLPAIVQALDQPTLMLVSRAYATLEAVPAMRVPLDSGVPYLREDASSGLVGSSRV